MARRRRTDSKTAVAYIRVSTARQVDEGLSLEQQERAVRAYADLRGLTLAAVVIESGVSASKPLASRPDGKRLVELLREHRAGSVVAVRLDRLFRDLGDCVATVADWERAGVALHLLDLGGQTVDTSTAMGRTFIALLAGVAEIEREKISERVSDAMAHKRAKGEKTGGSHRFGYRVAADGRTVVPFTPEQEIITRIKRLRSNGLSIREIRDRLEAAGVPSRGRRWHATTVSRILKAEAM